MEIYKQKWQGKTTCSTNKGKDVVCDVEDQIVLENHHRIIFDYLQAIQEQFNADLK